MKVHWSMFINVLKQGLLVYFLLLVYMRFDWSIFLYASRLEGSTNRSCLVEGGHWSILRPCSRVHWSMFTDAWWRVL